MSRPRKGDTTTAPPPEAPRAPTPEEIARRAREIWLARGGGPGNDLEDWLQAERELRGEGWKAPAEDAPPAEAPVTLPRRRRSKVADT
ncbi:MAG TPA: DUF2934 domain-containing protein [Vicinamibacteria bacterium]|nr:DUF2934 domain-containing protein [Vicinamibacteria bacterium]